MAKSYKVTAFEKGDFTDPHGNFWCTAVLEGVGEPVKIVVKDPMKYSVGMELYGDVTEQTSKAGKPYLRFKRVQQDDTQQSFGNRGSSSKPREFDSSGAKHGNALKIAADYLLKQDIATSEDFVKQLEHLAKRIYSIDVPVTGSTNPGTTKEFTNQSDVEFATNMARNLDKGIPVTEEFNMEDIPF